MILTQDQLALENSLRRILPAGVVSCWIPDGYGGAKDVIGDNHGKVIGAHPNVPVITPPIEQIADCETLTDWTGTDLSLVADPKEGTYCLQDTIATPTVGTKYNTLYDPAGTWDWSDKEDILLFLRSDRPSTDFASVSLWIIDSLGNYRYWFLSFITTWTAIQKPISAPASESTTPIDLSLISGIRVQFKAADETPFWKRIDKVRVTAKPSLINPSVGFHTDGVDDRIDCGNDASLNITKKITIGAWLKYGHLMQGSKVIAGKGNRADPDNMAYSLEAYQANVYFMITNTTPERNYPAFNEMTVGWHYVVGTLDGIKASIYVDTDLKDSDDWVGGDIQTVPENFIIGYGSHAATFFSGHIALLFVANKSWPQAQVKNFGNATKSLFSPRGF